LTNIATAKQPSPIEHPEDLGRFVDEGWFEFFMGENAFGWIDGRRKTPERSRCHTWTS